MSYDKNTWAKGDVITANKLNHIEDGIENAGGGGGITLVNISTQDGETFTADKTFAELFTAYSNGNLILYQSMGTYGFLYYHNEESQFIGTSEDCSSPILLIYKVWYDADEVTASVYQMNME